MYLTEYRFLVWRLQCLIWRPCQRQHRTKQCIMFLMTPVLMMSA